MRFSFSSKIFLRVARTPRRKQRHTMWTLLLSLRWSSVRPNSLTVSVKRSHRQSLTSLSRKRTTWDMLTSSTSSFVAIIKLLATWSLLRSACLINRSLSWTVGWTRVPKITTGSLFRYQSISAIARRLSMSSRRLSLECFNTLRTLRRKLLTLKTPSSSAKSILIANSPWISVSSPNTLTPTLTSRWLS